jgi:D-serine deaminase-like pyridoxal phosphate-dependent protein
MYQPQTGDPLVALDTPAMIVDVQLMEENIARLMARFRGTPVSVRPHLKTAKSPKLAHRLFAAGAIGGCVAKVSEAEVMAQAGIEDLLITSEIVGSPKVRRLVNLLRQHPSLVRLRISQRAKAPLAILAWTTTKVGSPLFGLTVKNFGTTKHDASTKGVTVWAYSIAARLMIGPILGRQAAIDSP